MPNSVEQIADRVLNGNPDEQHMLITISCPPHHLGFASIGVCSTADIEFMRKAAEYAVFALSPSKEKGNSDVQD